MDATEFLARILPTNGNYFTITWPHKEAGRGWPSRSFPLEKGTGQAASWLSWATHNQIDIYHAVAAFAVGDARSDTKGRDYVVAPRTQGNAQALRTLFLDIDVARPGDGKDPARIYPDRKSALTWLYGFCAAIKLPLPSIMVDSGYGYHVYWTLEQPLPVAAWLPLAQALKDAVIAHHFVGDNQIITDSARILRPPGTVNMKSGTPVPVKVVNKPRADLANAVIEQALRPWITTTQATGTFGGGHTASVISLGPRPPHVQPGDTSLNDAAAAGVDHREWKFATIAQKCEQVKQSLAAGGNGDHYHLWTSHHTLAAFCVDGADYVHPISARDHRYNEQRNADKFAQTQSEVARKILGAPRCTTYQTHRSGVCQTCRWFGKLNSPISLGVDDGDLPYNYRRRAVGSETLIEWRNADGDWLRVLHGDAFAPKLDHLATGGYVLSFTHELGGTKSAVACKGAEMGHAPTILGIVERQGISADRHSAGRVGDFVVAWINQLRTQRVERGISLKPFGWNHDLKGERVGVAIAGTHYRRDGAEEMIPGGDPKIRAMYQPRGSFDNWRKAASLFENKRPDLQLIIACAFASPLVALLSEVRGMSINFWSNESGVGKTSASRLGMSVWGDFTTLSSMDDTPNAAMKSLSEPRILARFWDELRVKPQWQENWVSMIYTIPQGKERARMMSDTTLREVGEWEAILVFTSNRPYSDILLAVTAGTDSGLYRLLEVQLRKEQQQYQADAGPLLKLTETNYGHAGRIYAKYLATHDAEIETLLHSTAAKIGEKLGARREERFYVTAIATIIVGAKIATQLGLFNFDTAGMYRHLAAAFVRSRGTVENRTLVATEGGYDLEQVLADYYYETADMRLRTKTFATRGGNGKTEVVARPRTEIAMVQYCESPTTLRALRAHLTEWLGKRNLPGTVVIEQFRKDLGATIWRQVLGGGTTYAGPKTWVVDIPLTAAMIELMDDAEDDEDEGEAAKAKAQRPAASAPLKGNEAAL